MKINKLLMLAIIPGMIACGSSEDVLPALADEEIVSQANAELTIEFSTGESETSVQSNLALINSINEVDVSWVSSDTDIIAIDGTVNQPSFSVGDQSIDLTATLSKGAVSQTKTFNLTVVALDISNDELLVAEAKESLSIMFAEGEDASAVKNNVVINTESDNGVQISWSSSNQDIVSETGFVNRPTLEDASQQITLTATLSAGSVSDTKIFDLTVISHEFSTDLTNSLIADYSFNDQTAIDNSGNQNNGTLVGTSTGTDRFENENAALIFDGATSKVDLPNQLLLQQSLSISIWMKTSTGGCLIGHQTNVVEEGSPQWVPILYVREDATMNATFWNGVVGSINDNTVLLNDNQWHHIVIVADADSQTLYIDNEFSGSGTGMRILSGMIHNQLGKGHTNGWPSAPSSDNPFEGSLDDVKIYDRVLNVSEIEVLYKSADPI